MLIYGFEKLSGGDVLEFFFSAMTLGSIYALIAVGYTMVYGIIQLVNFAHGEIFMMGTYFALFLMTVFGVPFIYAMILAMVGCFMLGALVDWSAYLPLRRKKNISDWISTQGLIFIAIVAIVIFIVQEKRNVNELTLSILKALFTGIIAIMLVLVLLERIGKLGPPKSMIHTERLNALITAIGMSLFLQTLAQLMWTANYRTFGSEKIPEFFREIVFSIGGVPIQGKVITTWAITLFVLIFLYVLVSYTKIGLAMRACAQDKETAALMGVNVNTVISFTFMTGSMMAAVAGIMYAIQIGGNISPRMGYYPGVIAFAAAVLGGIGDLRGAVIGGFLIGCTESVGNLIDSRYSFAFAFGLMIIIILFRPYGIFGKASAKRA